MAKSAVQAVIDQVVEEHTANTRAMKEVSNLNSYPKLGVVTNMYPEDGAWRHTYFVDARGTEQCHKVTDQTSALKELILLQTRVERANQGQVFTMPTLLPPKRTRLINMASSWPLCKSCMSPAPRAELNEYGGLCWDCGWNGGVSDIITDDGEILEDATAYASIDF